MRSLFHKRYTSLLVLPIVMLGILTYSKNNLSYTARSDDSGSKIADVLVVGAGLSGATIANLHATIFGDRVLVVEKRNHIGGNCFDFTNDLGIRVNKYGAHLFHTNNITVWKYLSQFSKWMPYEHRVVSNVNGTLVPIPVNIITVNQLLNKSISNKYAMMHWLNANQVHNKHPANGEEAAKARVGEYLYEALFKGYTYKQWAKFPDKLAASVLQRIPVRINFDDRYFPNDIYQALPSNGYTAMVRNMLQHPLITVDLETDYMELRKTGNHTPNKFSKTYFTGPVDDYFHSSDLPRLEYRSIDFETMNLPMSFYQPNSVVNYPNGPERFTRIVEYKHLYNMGPSDSTTIVKEYSTDSGDPYYPVPNKRNQEVYQKYASLAKAEEENKRVFFVGRLASYKYFNMDQAVASAMDTFLYANEELEQFPEIKSPNPEATKVSISFILNHCHEEMDFLKDLVVPYCTTHKVSVFIYEKCEDTTTGMYFASHHPHCNVRQIVLPNIGREGQTWIHHMLTKQTMFADINVFIQGQKHALTSFIQGGIRQLQNKTKFQSKQFVDESNLESQCIPLIYGRYIVLPADSFFNMSTSDWKRLHCEYCNDFAVTCKQCMRLFVHHCGEFIVTEAILRRTLARFRTVLVKWNRDLSRSTNPPEGHVLERLWIPFLLKHY